MLAKKDKQSDGLAVICLQVSISATWGGGVGLGNTGGQ